MLSQTDKIMKYTKTILFQKMLINNQHFSMAILKNNRDDQFSPGSMNASVCVLKV